MTRHLAVVGPTASGKSALAFAIAQQQNDIEIVSLDSMQVYRGMDIGTAKPTPAERDAVTHHLIDVADPDEEWSVRATQRLAGDAIAAIEGRGNRALLVGGTGLYVRAVVDDLEVPATDPVTRAGIEARVADDESLAAAYAQLQATDPIAASRIEPGNRRRIVRALEVEAITGRPFSSFGTGLDDYAAPAIDVTLTGLHLDGPRLAPRLASRFHTMLDAGFLTEVRALAARPSGLSRTAREAIGYKELLAVVAGDMRIDEATEAAIARTRKFARRQRVWFRRDPRIQWFDAGQKLDDLAVAVLARWNRTAPAETTIS